MSKQFGVVDQGSFVMWGKHFIVDSVWTGDDNAQLVRFHYVHDIYDVYEWEMNNILKAMNGN